MGFQVIKDKKPDVFSYLRNRLDATKIREISSNLKARKLPIGLYG